MAGLAALIARPLGARLEMHALFDTVASFGLFAMLLVCLDWVISRIGSGAFNQMYRTGLLLGALAGLVGGCWYALTGMPGVGGPQPPAVCTQSAAPILYVRVVVYSMLIGGGLHCLIMTAVMPRLLSGVSKQKKIALLGVSLLLLGLIAVLTGENLRIIGIYLRIGTLGLIDWVGSGNCPTLAASNDLGSNFSPISIEQILALLAVFAIAEFGHFAGRARARMTHSLAATAVMVAVSIPVLMAFWYLRPQRDLLGMFPFAAIWVVFAVCIYALLSRTANKSVADALKAAFPDAQSLDSFVRSRFPITVGRSPQVKDLATDAQKLVSRADNEGWLDDLIIAARYKHPTNSELASVADALGLGIAPPDPATFGRVAQIIELEARRVAATAEAVATPTEENVRRDYESIRKELAQYEYWICRVEGPAKTSHGTGVLIGPDLVITNLHVYEQALKSVNLPEQVIFRFDYRARGGATVSEGTPFIGAHAELVARSGYVPKDQRREPESSELDFAVVRLSEPAGNLPLGPFAHRNIAEDANELRGWMSAERVGAAKNLEPIVILHHPDGDPLRPDIGVVIGPNDLGSRVFHTTFTEGGSSGSPCLSHHSGLMVGLHDAAIGADGPFPDGRKSAIPYLLVAAAIKGHETKTGED